MLMLTYRRLTAAIRLLESTLAVFDGEEVRDVGQECVEAISDAAWLIAPLLERDEVIYRGQLHGQAYELKLLHQGRERASQIEELLFDDGERFYLDDGYGPAPDLDMDTFRATAAVMGLSELLARIVPADGGLHERACMLRDDARARMDVRTVLGS